MLRRYWHCRFLTVAVMGIFILKYLQLIKLNYSENRFLYALLVFVCIPFFLEISSAASVLYGRWGAIFMFFSSIMFAKLVIRNNVFSAVFIIFYFIYRIGFSFNNPDILLNLMYLGDGRPLYIFNGIFLLINGYDSDRYLSYMTTF